MKLQLAAVLLVALTLVKQGHGHGYLRNPPSRSSMWRMGFNVPQNYNDNALNCGGNRRQCGVCGDPPNAAQDNVAGGKYATGQISKTYTEGDTIKTSVVITANHAGWFEFHLCENNDVARPATEQCFMRHVLTQGNGQTRYDLKRTITGPIDITLKLPPGVTCSQCVLRWKWMTGNSWGTDPATGQSCVGCGDHQEQFYGCSDVSITPRGAVVGPTSAPGVYRPVTNVPYNPYQTNAPYNPYQTQSPYNLYPTQRPIYNTQAPYNPYPQNTQAPYNPYQQNTQAPYNPYPQNTQAPYNPYQQNTQAPYNPYPQYTQAPYNPYQQNTQAPYNPYPQNTQAPYNPYQQFTQGPYSVTAPLILYPTRAPATAAPYNPYATQRPVYTQTPYNPYQQNTQSPYNPYPQNTQAPYNPYQQNTQRPYNPYPQNTLAPYNPVNQQYTQAPYRPTVPLILNPTFGPNSQINVGPNNFRPPTNSPVGPNNPPTIAPTYRPITAKPHVPYNPYNPNTQAPYNPYAQNTQAPYNPALNPGVQQGGAASCHAIGQWALQPDMLGWCQTNCAAGNCPPDMCSCSKRRVVDADADVHKAAPALSDDEPSEPEDTVSPTQQADNEISTENLLSKILLP